LSAEANEEPQKSLQPHGQAGEDAGDTEPLSLPEPQFPIFYDQERRRWPLFVRIGAWITFVFSVALIILIVSLIALPLMPRTRLPKVTATNAFGNLEPVLDAHDRRALNYKHEQELKTLNELAGKTRQARRDRERRAREYERKTAPRAAKGGSHSSSPGETLAPSPVPANPEPVVAAFYVNWEESARPATHRNIRAITHLIPEWLHLKPTGSNLKDSGPGVLPFVDVRDQTDKTDITPLAHANGVPILALINNYTQPKGAESGVGSWDVKALHEVISDPAVRKLFIGKLFEWLRSEKLQGINIDFEEVDSDDRASLVAFMRELYAVLHPAGLLVTQEVQLGNDSYDLAQLAKWNDWLVPMFYDEHTEDTPAGPVASISWTKANLASVLHQVPAAKIVMAVGNHGYDWVIGREGAASVTYQSATITAKESMPLDQPIHIDPDSLNPTFRYTDAQTDSSGKPIDVQHVVWMEDAASVYNQLAVARPHNIRGAALWYLGAEDPGIWSYFDKSSWTKDWSTIISAGRLNTISYGGQGEVDFEGEGELLQPLAPPSDGKRTVALDPTSKLITTETYLTDSAGRLLVPSSWVVRRYAGLNGNANKQIVLTFDDGPDPTWTPQILDILHRYHVPACFFVVGRMAENYPNLVRREWDQGCEIGNHSYTHPDLFRLSTVHQRLELTTTQRVIEAITGHSTILFRPPYGGDIEPETGREVSPIMNAAELNYITVGESNDPQDWRLFAYIPGTEAMDTSQPRSAEEIINSVIVNRDVGSVVLLHDAGGDRSNTVAALPVIITRLRALGYKFTTISELAGIPAKRLMPPVTGKDLLLVGADRYVFEVTYLLQRTLTTLFILSILLGISRTVLFLFLALIQRAKERKRVFPVGFTPSVSVIIAAYNEEKVIARTIRALLESNYPDLEIIVVDDGSADQTSAVVTEAFGSDPRVQLFRKPNGGKASALNRGLLAAKGEIMVSLDADTLFAPDTISRLARHFADPAVGAVSGNVRVGNAHNILTRWQSLEYITAQNFDRRGYDLLNCITVVPGAVGALRRRAVIDVGGYTHDTLAEDTDLTWKMRRAGWRIVNDNSALAYTEAPESLRNLAKQRFRWAFGTLQCLWKHRGALGQDGAFGWLALPSLWIYQILFPTISPFMDIAMVWSLFAGNFLDFAKYFLLMFSIEFVAAVIAIRMDKGDPKLLPWMLLQRFVYRQMMYYVILKSVVAAIRGGAVGWGKFERTGTARIEERAA
jgi:cellulose synthase/poly-beta-1,6-N-acetylglucosamine synthase-like glycosyltransferase/peptidoglycan/xylan/chitin deacetylase (PgdA/CDA1 family)/spore germination protein YaaH